MLLQSTFPGSEETVEAVFPKLPASCYAFTTVFLKGVPCRCWVGRNLSSTTLLTPPHNPAWDEKSTGVRQKGMKRALRSGKKRDLGWLGQERHSAACQRHQCQIQSFCCFSYNKRFPLPSALLSDVLCTLSNSYKELYEQPLTSFHAIKNPASVTCGHWILATNGPGFFPKKERSQNLCVQEAKAYSPDLWQNYKAQWIKLSHCPSIQNTAGKHPLKWPLGFWYQPSHPCGSSYTDQETFLPDPVLLKGCPFLPISPVLRMSK